MRFPPKPENDFTQFIRTYYDECRCRFPKVEAIAGKWMFRDLIPGMSDFDSRLIVSDDMTADDWCRMSTAIGELHLALCERYPCWARNLEHLPGVNLTWDEVTCERTYYPEYKQWSFYHTEEPDKVSALQAWLARRPWDIKDECFHLKKFCTYYGRYNRSIDPAINLGAHAVKYPLHSRVMHYFNPPVMSAMCLLKRTAITGKFDAFEIAASLFPELKCWEMVGEILHANYETPKWYHELHLSKLEDELETALVTLAGALRDFVTIPSAESGVDVSAWKNALNEVQIDPAMAILENAKFSRLMKGRLRFYANAPESFDVAWLIRNELGRIDRGFFVMPFRTFWQIQTGTYVEDPVTILDDLRGEVLSDREVEGAREFHRLAGAKWAEGDERKAALAIAGVFDDFYTALHKISRNV